MDEARRVLERLERIETLRSRRAGPPELLSELRALVDEGRAWLERERASRREDAAPPPTAGDVGDARTPAASVAASASPGVDGSGPGATSGPKSMATPAVDPPDAAIGSLSERPASPGAPADLDAERAEVALRALDSALAGQAALRAAGKEVVRTADAA